MRNKYSFLLLCTAVGLLASCGQQNDTSVTEYRNATWWDGRTEFTGSRFVRDGRFVDGFGVKAGTVVDLGGRLVTAPFGEGHNHNVVDAIFERSNTEYLASGVFYVKTPFAYPSSIERIRDDLERADTVDSIFSMGGLTAPGGHPIGLIMNALADTVYGGATYDDLAGQAFHEVATEDDVVAAIESLDAQGADFVKALLQYSEDYLAADYDGRPLQGLHPDLLEVVVRESHARELPVMLHVSSAADFRAGVAAGVDEIAHLPGRFWSDDRDPEAMRLTAADAESAKASGVAVVTTLYSSQVRFQNQPELLAEFESMQQHNLETLIAAGVEIRIGSDIYDLAGTGEGAFPTRGEAETLVALGVFDAEGVLERWIDTGRDIFPERRIACFEPGCEASFLVFDADPRDDIANLRSMSAGIKQGGLVSGELGD